VWRVIHDCLPANVIFPDETALRIKFFGIWWSHLSRISVSPSLSFFCLQSCLFLEEIRFHLQDVLIKVGGLETGHCDVKICLHDGGNVTLVDAVVESLDVVVMWKDPVDFGLYKDIWNYCRKMISCNLFVFVERIRLFDNFHDFLKLLEFAKGCLLLLHPAGLLNGHLPSVAHWVLNLDSKGACGEFL